MPTWITSRQPINLEAPVAVVGSPGLRSIGKLVVEKLIQQTHAELAADLYSTHLPTIYETKPSYAAHPALPGTGGVLVEAGQVDLPKVQFYTSIAPPLILCRGYHANFQGQYEVARKVMDYLAENHVKRVVVAAGFGFKDKKVFCAATEAETIQEMKQKYDIDTGYKGPFMGFSGLVFGEAKRHSIPALCLFASTEPKEDDLEFPDEEAAQRALDKLNLILGIHL
jgi:predicted ATP-grasp superfamily ATP-dependent carboligase